MVISTINHSYWSYVHQLSYRTGASHCMTIEINMPNKCYENTARSANDPSRSDDFVNHLRRPIACQSKMIWIQTDLSTNMDINVIPPGKFEINVIPPGNFEINLIPPAISTNMEIGYSKITAGFIDDSLGFLAMFQPIEADIGRIGRASCPRVLKMDLQYTCRRESHAMPTSYTYTVTYIICIYIYICIWMIMDGPICFCLYPKNVVTVNYFGGYIWVKEALGLFLVLIHRHWWPDVCFVPMVKIVAVATSTIWNEPEPLKRLQYPHMLILYI